MIASEDKECSGWEGLGVDGLMGEVCVRSSTCTICHCANLDPSQKTRRFSRPLIGESASVTRRVCRVSKSMALRCRRFVENISACHNLGNKYFIRAFLSFGAVADLDGALVDRCSAIILLQSVDGKNMAFKRSQSWSLGNSQWAERFGTTNIF